MKVWGMTGDRDNGKCAMKVWGMTWDRDNDKCSMKVWDMTGDRDNGKRAMKVWDMTGDRNNGQVCHEGLRHDWRQRQWQVFTEGLRHDWRQTETMYKCSMKVWGMTGDRDNGKCSMKVWGMTGDRQKRWISVPWGSKACLETIRHPVQVCHQDLMQVWWQTRQVLSKCAMKFWDKPGDRQRYVVYDVSAAIVCVITHECLQLEHWWQTWKCHSMTGSKSNHCDLCLSYWFLISEIGMFFQLLNIPAICNVYSESGISSNT